MFDDLMIISLLVYVLVDYVRQKTENGQKSPIFAHHPFFVGHSPQKHKLIDIIYQTKH